VDRRRFLVGTIGASSVSLASPWLGGAAAATDDELAFANFGASVEYLVKDFYERAIAAKITTRTGTDLLRRGRSAAAQHAKALSELLTAAGDVAPVEEDFAFEWPARTFGSARSIASTGTSVLRALLGAYQTAAASVSEPSYRILYASLAASVGQQIGALATLSPRAAVEPFPVAVDLEAASGALERYLG
jgi:ferritin-like protein